MPSRASPMVPRRAAPTAFSRRARPSPGPGYATRSRWAAARRNGRARRPAGPAWRVFSGRSIRAPRRRNASTCMSGRRAPTAASARSWCGCMAARFISARPTALSPTAPTWRGAAMSLSSRSITASTYSGISISRRSAASAMRIPATPAPSISSPRSNGCATISSGSAAIPAMSRFSASRAAAAKSACCSRCRKRAGCSTAPSSRAARRSASRPASAPRRSPRRPCSRSALRAIHSINCRRCRSSS